MYTYIYIKYVTNILYTLQSSESSSDVGIRRGRGLSHISNLTPHLPLRMIDLVVMMMMMMMRAVMSEMRAFMMMEMATLFK